MWQVRRMFNKSVAILFTALLIPVLAACASSVPASSTEWSFVITSSGIVHERFESFTGYGELETSLKEVL